MPEIQSIGEFRPKSTMRGSNKEPVTKLGGNFQNVLPFVFTYYISLKSFSPFFCLIRFKMVQVFLAICTLLAGSNLDDGQLKLGGITPGILFSFVPRWPGGYRVGLAPERSRKAPKPKQLSTGRRRQCESFKGKIGKIIAARLEAASNCPCKMGPPMDLRVQQYDGIFYVLHRIFAAELFSAEF